MEDISDEDYTYDAGIPWPERAERRIVDIEKRIVEAESEIAVLKIQLANLARIVHRLLNAGEVQEDDGK